MVAVTSGCSDAVERLDKADGGDVSAELVGVEAAAGIVVDVVADGLPGPTQFVVAGDDTFVVAVLNGGENDRVGEVWRVDAKSGEFEVLQADLDKPTGVALVNDELWVMERNRLTRGPVGGKSVVVVEGLPYNGRSEGTLTLTPAGHILFNTSGALQGGDAVAGSGRLYTVDPSEQPGRPAELASGFKHAYGHTFDDADTLWSTELTDGTYDGQPGADELVAVTAGAHHGWPRCVGDNRPVAEYGGSAEACEAVPASAAVFAAGATPTSVAVSPFDDGVLLVALWNEGRVVGVETAGDEPGAVLDVVTGLAGPQHLVATDDAVYLSEFGTGRLLRITSG